MDLFNQINFFSTNEVRKTEFDIQGVDVNLYENFFSIEESNTLYNSLLKNTLWEQDQMTIYGKQINLPRLTAWYGETDKAVSYADNKHKIFAWNADLIFIKERIEQDVTSNLHVAFLIIIETEKTV